MQGRQPGRGREPVVHLPDVPVGTPNNANPLPDLFARGNVSTQVQRSFVVKADGQRTPAIWGKKVKTGGLMWGPWVVNGTLVVLYEVCHGPIEAMDFSLGNTTAAALHAATGFNYEIFLGTASQGLSTIMSQVPGWTSSLPGKAYCVFQIFPPTLAGQQVPDPEDFHAFVDRGLLCLDPRLGVDGSGIPNQPKAATSNPALIWADFKTSRRYGLGEPLSAVDWVMVGAAATDCDLDIGGGVKQYEMGYKLDPSQSLNPDDVVNSIRQNAFMSEAFYNGKWKVWINKAQSAASISFDENNIIDAYWREKGRSECPTRWRVNFVDWATGYKDDHAEDMDPGIATNTVEDVPAEVTSAAPTFDQAMRLAIQYRNQAKKCDKEYWILVGPEGMLVTPGIRMPVTSQQCNLVAVDMVVKDVTCYGSTFLVWMERYDSTVFNTTPQSRTAPTTATPPSPFDVPPAPTLLRFNPNGDLYWAPSQVLSQNLYGSSFWTGVGVGSFFASRVNDADLVTSAFDLNVASDSTVTYDAGVGKKKYFTALKVTCGGAVLWPAVIEYSDDMSAWTPVTGMALLVTDATILGYDFAGGHRGWRCRKNTSVASNVNVQELQWLETDGPRSFIIQYSIVDKRSGSQLYQNISALDIPTSAKGFPISPLTTFGASTVTDFDIVAVTNAWVRSTALNYSRSVAASSSYAFSAVTLSNGDNNDVNFGSLQVGFPQGSVVEITGPTLPFAITGIQGGFPGADLLIYNQTTQTMTLKNENGSSSAGNRLKTSTGADIALLTSGNSGVTWALFRYLSVTQRWVLVAARDAGGIK